MFSNYQLGLFVFISLSACIKLLEILMSLTAIIKWYTLCPLSLEWTVLSPKCSTNHIPASLTLGKKKCALAMCTLEKLKFWLSSISGPLFPNCTTLKTHITLAILGPEEPILFSCEFCDLFRMLLFLERKSL